MTVPAGVVVTGAVHRHEHLCTVSKGRIAVSTDEGMREISAPCTIVSKAGTKRVGYAIEETVWTTYHVTNETDVDKIIEEITESTNAELLGGAENVQLRIAADREDYTRFLQEYGLTQDVVTRLVENPADQVATPKGVADLELRESPVHGAGLFATRSHEQGEIVAPVRLSNMRTPAGRYMNHSAKPNVAFRDVGNGDLVAEALVAIKAGEEVSVDYRQAMAVNGSGIKPIKEHS
ncbi:SET domain-containing protein-lysine N-methyltransferase [Paraburkholderia caffeinilytica]|uniref:SET domain-containing protein-lysine N-methyltransferase n=1 Tax=Paraburkholderia caffeinilytica TaxID=1761016 RepID=UPI0038BA13F6